MLSDSSEMFSPIIPSRSFSSVDECSSSCIDHFLSFWLRMNMFIMLTNSWNALHISANFGERDRIYFGFIAAPRKFKIHHFIELQRSLRTLFIYFWTCTKLHCGNKIETKIVHENLMRITKSKIGFKVISAKAYLMKFFFFRFHFYSKKRWPRRKLLLEYIVNNVKKKF